MGKRCVRHREGWFLGVWDRAQVIGGSRPGSLIRMETVEHGDWETVLVDGLSRRQGKGEAGALSDAGKATVGHSQRGGQGSWLDPGSRSCRPLGGGVRRWEDVKTRSRGMGVLAKEAACI